MMRAIALAITLAASALGIAACTPGGSTITMTPHEARDGLVDFIERSASLIDVTGWANDGSPGVQECSASGQPGVKYNYGYFVAAPAGRDKLADARAVADDWMARDLSVRLIEAPDAVVFAEGGPAQNVSFSTAPGDYYISGTSICVPGDFDEVFDEQTGRDG